jgi:hypothetical protein
VSTADNFRVSAAKLADRMWAVIAPRHPVGGGHLPGPTADKDAVPVVLSLGGEITDSDQAEQLGLTADARRLRRERERGARDV